MRVQLIKRVRRPDWLFGEKETRLYFNGKLVLSIPPTKAKGGTHFVVGNVGENHPIDYFLGQIRSVRISKGERYTADFQPDEDFRRDETAVLIYSAKSVEGGTVHDLSGNGNDGAVERF